MKLFALLVLIIIATMLSGCIINGGISNSVYYSDFDKYSVGSFSKEGLDNNKLYINWISGNVIVSKGNDNTFKVYEETNETEDKYKMHYYDSSEVFYVQFCASEKTITHKFKQKDLFIVVPLNYSLENIEISSVSSDLLVQDLILNEVEIENVSGEVKLSSLNSHILSVDNVSGKVVLSKVSSNDLSIDNISGNINSDELSLNKVDIETVSGDINLSVINEPTEIDLETVSGGIILSFIDELGFSAKINKVSSDFNCEFPTVITNKRYVHLDGACMIDVSTVSGNVNINKIS